MTSVAKTTRPLAAVNAECESVHAIPSPSNGSTDPPWGVGGGHIARGFWTWAVEVPSQFPVERVRVGTTAPAQTPAGPDRRPMVPTVPTVPSRSCCARNDDAPPGFRPDASRFAPDCSCCVRPELLHRSQRHSLEKENAQPDRIRLGGGEGPVDRSRATDQVGWFGARMGLVPPFPGTGVQ